MNIDILNKISQAARDRKILRIVYFEKDGTSEGWRDVEPYSFRGESESKALFAWDIHKDGIRRFTLNRIEQAEVSSDIYNPRFTVEIS